MVYCISILAGIRRNNSDIRTYNCSPIYYFVLSSHSTELNIDQGVRTASSQSAHRACSVLAPQTDSWRDSLGHLACHHTSAIVQARSVLSFPFHRPCPAYGTGGRHGNRTGFTFGGQMTAMSGQRRRRKSVARGDGALLSGWPSVETPPAMSRRTATQMPCETCAEVA